MHFIRTVYTSSESETRASVAVDRTVVVEAIDLRRLDEDRDLESLLGAGEISITLDEDV